MNATLKVLITRTLAVLLAVSVLMCSMAFGASALLNSVVSSSTVSSGVSYAKYSATNANAHVMEFNPQTTELMPLAYTKWAGGNAAIADQIAHAEAAGYTVHGAINGEFFSMASGNAGTLTGRLISNGRVVTDQELNDEYSLVIDNEGNWSFVQSELAYHLYIGGNKIVDIARINKRFNGTWAYDCICYFDSACGLSTDTVSSYPGVEVVFNKLGGGELIPEGVLEGEVVSVDTGAYGTAFTENQFVLTAANGTMYYDTLANLTVGQRVQIYVEEQNSDAKEVMKNANSTMAATYPVVIDGVNTTATKCPTSSIGQLSLTERAQRTAIGVKPDGTYVYFVSSGRSSMGYGPGAGLTIAEVGDAMIELGCKYAVNLDGGGSSTMIAGGETKYTTENRKVGSAMLIVSRNDATTTPAKKSLVNTWIEMAQSTSYASPEQQAAVDTAVAAARTVYSDSRAMNGNYIRAYMDIQSAMGERTSVTPKNYISLKAADWVGQSTMSVTNDTSGALILQNTDGKWPSAEFHCDIAVPLDAVLVYDMTVAGTTSIVLNNNDALSLNTVIAGDNLEVGNSDILGNGRSFKGTITVSDMIDEIVAFSEERESAFGTTAVLREELIGDDGMFHLSSLKVYAIGSAGDGSKVTIRSLGFPAKYESGDVNGDCIVNSMDARMVLRTILEMASLTEAQQYAADVNGDGDITTADARQILCISVGLV